jgi:hypothetical protein
MSLPTSAIQSKQQFTLGNGVDNFYWRVNKVTLATEVCAISAQNGLLVLTATVIC